MYPRIVGDGPQSGLGAITASAKWVQGMFVWSAKGSVQDPRVFPFNTRAGKVLTFGVYSFKQHRIQFLPIIHKWELQPIEFQADLSHTLQQLSEKAKKASEDIGRLKQLQESIAVSC